jgi:hypothetical protein
MDTFAPFRLVEKHYSLPCGAIIVTYIFNYGSNVGVLFNEGILSQNALQKYEMTD